MDTLFQEETRRTSSPWEGSGANTPALAAEVDDSGNVEYKVCSSSPFHLQNGANMRVVKFSELFT
jgi:hypothetical protein